MQTKRPNYKLLYFVEHLYEMHTHVVYGFNNVKPDDAMARCQRWLDAVLQPPPEEPQYELPLCQRNNNEAA
jgi:hypothetical protein